MSNATFRTRLSRELLAEQQGSYEILSNGRTTWVNGIICVGRFCKYGIDLSETCAAKMTTPTYPEGGTTLADWRVFQTLMREVYGVHVSDRQRPEFLDHPPCPAVELRPKEPAAIRVHLHHVEPHHRGHARRHTPWRLGG